MFNLESIWINQDGLNKINSFHVRCLRQICRIAPSFISRVPNSEIYALCGESFLSRVLHKRQTMLYQSITELPENDVMRKLTCVPNSVYPKVWDNNRKRGRPKQQWAPCVFKLALQMGTIVVWHVGETITMRLPTFPTPTITDACKRMSKCSKKWVIGKVGFQWEEYETECALLDELL